MLTLALFLGIPWLARPGGKFGNPKDSGPAFHKITSLVSSIPSIIYIAIYFSEMVGYYRIIRVSINHLFSSYMCHLI